MFLATRRMAIDTFISTSFYKPPIVTCFSNLSTSFIHAYRQASTINLCCHLYFHLKKFRQEQSSSNLLAGWACMHALTCLASPSHQSLSFHCRTKAFHNTLVFSVCRQSNLGRKLIFIPLALCHIDHVTRSYVTSIYK